MKSFFLGLAVMAIAMTSPANILQDFSFENPALVANSSSDSVSGQFIGGVWRTSSGGTRLRRNDSWTFSQGSQGLELVGGISYDTAVTGAGDTYRLSFDMTALPLSIFGNTETLSVSINGPSIFYPSLNLGYFSALPLDYHLNSLSWTHYSVEFTTIAPASSIEFIGHSDSDDGFGPMIDNVVLEPVPEPACLVALAALLGITLIRRRR